jgi:hypothetical protein
MSEQPIDLGVLEQAALELTTEALSFRGSFDYLRQKLPAYFSKVTEFVSNSLSDVDVELDLLNESKHYQLSKKSNYMLLRRTPVMVPKGLATTYLKHLSTLNKAQDAVDGLIQETLEPFEKHLAVLLTDPSTLQSQRESKIVDKVVTHDIESIRDLIAKDFSRDGAERRPYGDLITRQAEWPKIASEYNDLVERLARVPRKTVLDLVKTISEHLDKLLQRMESDPETYAASGVSISELAKVSFVMAQEVEFYATHTFMIEQLQASIEAAGALATE